MRKVFVPASGSVIAKHSLREPSAMPGRKRCLIWSDPFLRMQALSMAVTRRRPGEKPLAQTSSKPIVRARRPAPLPPYSSGTRQPRSPTSANPCHSSSGKRFSRRASSRNSARRGSSRWSIVRTEVRTRLCSSLSAKFVTFAVCVVIVVPPYLPLNSGVRFSLKAFGPSRASSLMNTAWPICLSISRAWASGRPSVSWTERLTA